jgi:uncharacterized protein (DUF433 family)
LTAGRRIPVATALETLAVGASEAQVLHAYPHLDPDDLREALQFAAVTVRERELPLLAS